MFLAKRNSFQAFARKVLKSGVRLTQEEIERETAAVKKITAGPLSREKNIVTILDFGKLPRTPFYFIDMELCEISLEDYIYPSEPLNSTQSIPFFVKEAPPPMKARQIWNIMKQIANGVVYLHGLGIVHRDLKPPNSTFLILPP